MFAAVKDIKNFLPLAAAAINVGVVLRALEFLRVYLNSNVTYSGFSTFSCSLFIFWSSCLSFKVTMALDLMSSFIEPISNDTTFFTTISEQNLPFLETLDTNSPKRVKRELFTSEHEEIQSNFV